MGNRSRQPPGDRPLRPEPPPLRPGPDLGVPVHNPYTVEGRIEQVGAMARGIRGLRGGKKVVALTFFLLFVVAPVILAVVSMIGVWF